MALAAEPAIPEFTLGDRLAKARDFAGLSQQQMADKLDVKRTTLSTWERELSQPRDFMGVIDRWAEITGVDPAWLLGFRTGSVLTLLTNPKAVQPSLPFDRGHLAPV